MKKNQWVWMLAVAALSTSVSCFAVFEEGTDRGNGGDDTSREFVGVGYELVESLMKDPVAGVDTGALLAAVEATKVNSEEKLILRGNEVDAINYPHPETPRILVSRTGWERMAEESHRRVFLAFHEYLGIMGIDDSNYQISSRLDRAKVCERHPVVREAIEKALKKSCYRIIADDLKYMDNLDISGNPLEALHARDFAGLSNISHFYFHRTGVKHMPAQWWRLVPRLNMLSAPESLSLANCDFLRELPKLNSFYSGANMARKNGAPEGWLTEIGEGCFAGLPNLTFLALRVHGRLTNLAGFAKGMDVESLSLSGTELDSFPLAELALARRIRTLSLSMAEREFTDEYVKSVNKTLGFTNCSKNTTRNGKGEMHSTVDCHRS